MDGLCDILRAGVENLNVFICLWIVKVHIEEGRIPWVSPHFVDIEK